jgi:excisionase family DNA binding protein
MAVKLIPVDRAHETALGDNVSQWTVYKLIRENAISHVRVGRRVFLTEEGIEEFIRRGGTRAAVAAHLNLDAGIDRRGR